MRLLLVFPLWLLFSQVVGQPVARFCFDEPSGEGFTVDSVRGISCHYPTITATPKESTVYGEMPCDSTAIPPGLQNPEFHWMPFPVR